MATEDTHSAIGADDAEVEALLRRVDENAEELAELLDILDAARELSSDLAPELRRAVHENRDDLRDLRMALEREETLVLLQQLGHSADTLAALLDQLEAAEELSSDLAPELRRAVHENRDVLRRLRMAIENDDLVVLVERLGENAGELAELLELVSVSKDLAEDLAPELQAASQEHRSAIRDLRQIVAGVADTYDDHESVEPYTLGRNLGNMMWFAQRLGDPEVIDTFDAGLGAFAEDDPPRVGLLGLIGALRDREIQRGLGRVIEALRRMGRT
jgi:chromosome segregation ATPase